MLGDQHNKDYSISAVHFCFSGRIFVRTVAVILLLLVVMFL